jgi:hypothetical protein
MLKPITHTVMGLVAVLAIMLVACTSEAPGPTPASAPESESENTAVIRDRTGRVWDVTHARDVYDMNPDDFNYGLGIGAITSVDDPTVLEEGDSGYPSADSRTQVFGVNHNGKQRAYSVSALSRHEVFNDVYPGESNRYVAVTY